MRHREWGATVAFFPLIVPSDTFYEVSPDCGQSWSHFKVNMGATGTQWSLLFDSRMPVPPGHPQGVTFSYKLGQFAPLAAVPVPTLLPSLGPEPMLSASLRAQPLMACGPCWDADFTVLASEMPLLAVHHTHTPLLLAPRLL